MPFINSSSSGFGRRYAEPPIVTLEELLIVSCDNIITLNAIVEGGSASPTYFWEQVTGEPVIWLESQHQISTTFQQPAERDDKVFRFIVDQGRSTEVISYILVTGIPRDNIQELKLASVDYEQDYSDTEVVTTARMLPGFSPEGTGTLLNPLRGLAFTIPAGPYVESFRVVDITQGGETIIFEEITPLGNSLFHVPVSRSYRIDTVINIKGYRHVAKGSAVIGYFPPPPEYYVDADTYDRMPVELDVPDNLFVSVASFPRELIHDAVDDEQTSGLMHAASFYQTAASFPRELIVEDREDEINVHLSGAIFSVVKVVLPLGIGSLG